MQVKQLALLPLALLGAAFGHAASAAPCDTLAALVLSDTKIASAVAVAAGPYAPPDCKGAVCPAGDLPAFCKVVATVSPSADASTLIEIWLPQSGWNGRLQSIGNHGFGGTLYYVDMAEALKRGFATAATDEGHKPGAGPFAADFAVGHPQKVIDFAWRSIHEMTVATKAVVAAFYGKPADYAYFNGCSNGGREALMEAVRFPQDYDGIISGGAAANWTHAATEQLHMANAMFKDGPDGPSHLTAAQMMLVHRAVVRACDLADGVADGLIADPRRCAWNARDLVCQPGQDAASCLGAAQADAVNLAYAPVRDPATNRLMFTGQARGSEYDWVKFGIPANGAPFGVANYRYLVFNDPSWNGLSLDLARDLPQLDALAAPINVTDPDLSAFRRRGGRLIQYHGWGDSQFTPGWTVHYYHEVVRRMGGNERAALGRTQEFYRLFMMAGLGHCTGGPGPNTIGGLQQPPSPSLDAGHDIVSALQAWVEQGVAPAQIVATKYVDDSPAKGIAMQRPVCAFPAEATYRGAGPVDEAASFSCQPRPMNDEWEALE